MTIKLSAIGLEKVQNYSSVDLEIEGFEQDDFQDVVILTVKEAKQIKVFLDDAVELHDKGVVVIQSSGFDTVQMIKERIKQAEKCDEAK